jgi:uncharacterized protein YcgL (UPF0745 family)
MYLYVDKQEGVERVPEALLGRFGTPVPAMTLLIYPGRKLALVNADKVLEAVEQQGYYLQMPPQSEQYMSELHQKNSKM